MPMQFCPAAQNARCQSRVDICVSHDDHRRVAAEIHGQFLQTCRGGYALSRAKAARERDHTNRARRDDRLTEIAVADCHAQDIVGEPGCLKRRD